MQKIESVLMEVKDKPGTYHLFLDEFPEEADLDADEYGRHVEMVRTESLFGVGDPATYLILDLEQLRELYRQLEEIPGVKNDTVQSQE